MQEELTWYGVDWSGPVPHSDLDQVIVPEVPNPLPSYLFAVLEREVNPTLKSMENIGHTCVLVRAFVRTFTVDA